MEKEDKNSVLGRTSQLEAMILFFTATKLESDPKGQGGLTLVLPLT